MRKNPALRSTISDIVSDWVAQGKMFTAFEVSLAVKERGIEERHRNIRDLVHEVIFELGEPQGYTRTLRDVGAPEQAWVYHKPRDNPYNYQPLDRGGQPQPPVDVPYILPVSGVREPLKLNAGRRTPAAVPDGAYGTDQRGRLCIPVTLLAKLGVGPGQRVHVLCSKAEEKVLLTRPTANDDGDPDASYTVEPDGNVRITQSTLERAGLEHLPCYRIEGNASAISVGKLAWD